jgi:rubrerythrin
MLVILIGLSPMANGVPILIIVQATQEQIRDLYDKILAKIKEHQRAIAAARFTLKTLQDDCTHPNKFMHEDMKLEKTWHCPDCGWQSL